MIFCQAKIQINYIQITIKIKVIKPKYQSKLCHIEQVFLSKSLTSHLDRMK